MIPTLEEILSEACGQMQKWLQLKWVEADKCRNGCS